MDGSAPKAPAETIAVGRYVIGGVLASGGMASVHLGRLVAEHGFARTVAIKRLHAHLARDPDFVDMFLDEAHLASRIRHGNVVPVLDIVSVEHELFLVMEYVEGAGLNVLLRAARKSGVLVPRALVVRVVLDLLEGLHAAHDALGDNGQPLQIVHRDVSPQNLLVGTDGVSRVLDFGVAKAMGRLHQTRSSQIKGKLAYMAPEQLFGKNVTRQVDVFAAAVVLWEALTNQRLFTADSDGEMLQKVTGSLITPPSQLVRDIPPALDAVVMRGLERDPALRFASAAEMAEALEHASPPAPRRLVAQWVKETDRDQLSARASVVADFERTGSSTRLPAMRHPAPLGGSVDIPVDIDANANSALSNATVGGVAHDPNARGGSVGRKGVLLVAALGAFVVVGAGLGIVLARTRMAENAASAATATSAASGAAMAPPGAVNVGALGEPPSAVATGAPVATEAPATSASPSSAPPAASSATAARPPSSPAPAARPAPPANANAANAAARPPPPKPKSPAGAVPLYSRE